VTPDERVPQIALVSQSNAENRHKSAIGDLPVRSTYVEKQIKPCTTPNQKLALTGRELQPNYTGHKKRPHVELGEVHFRIHNFVLAS